MKKITAYALLLLVNISCNEPSAETHKPLIGNNTHVKTHTNETILIQTFTHNNRKYLIATYGESISITKE